MAWSLGGRVSVTPNLLPMPGRVTYYYIPTDPTYPVEFWAAHSITIFTPKCLKLSHEGTRRHEDHADARHSPSTDFILGRRLSASSRSDLLNSKV